MRTAHFWLGDREQVGKAPTFHLHMMTSVQGLPWRQALLVYFLCPGPELCSGDCLLVRPGTSVRPPCHSSPSLTFCQGPRVWPHKVTVGPCCSNKVRPPASCRARFERCLRALGKVSSRPWPWQLPRGPLPWQGPWAEQEGERPPGWTLGPARAKE